MNKKSQVIKIILGSSLLLLMQLSVAQTIGSTSINQPSTDPDRSSNNDQTIYPHISELMTAKTFDSYTVDLVSVGQNIEQPLCVLGDDSLSKEWISQE